MLFHFRIVVFLLMLFHADAKNYDYIDEVYSEKEDPVTNLIVADGSQIDIPWARDQKFSTSYKLSVVLGTPSLVPIDGDSGIISSTKRDQDISREVDEINFAEIRYNTMLSHVGISVAIITILSAMFGAIFYTSYNLYKRNKDAETVDYPAYGVTGPSAIGDDSEKNQLSQPMISPVSSGNHARDDVSDTDDEPDSVCVHPNSAGVATSAGAPRLPYNSSYTVFECAGLAAQMSRQDVVVKNPLFPDDTGRGDILKDE